ncbi:hypothetical protein [Phaffia rhodozyma]|uniref:Uncharacterized protein n=1 Tax=Phaffia rhodozyma TaxID=264483 RepID=A0A0F7SLI8_PHARH|nr:hypothetical protein [Phaffia rhodozyma]
MPRSCAGSPLTATTSRRPPGENEPLEVEIIDLANEDSDREELVPATMNQAEQREREQEGDDEDEISFQGSTGPRIRRFGRTLERILGEIDRPLQNPEEHSNTTSSHFNTYPQQSFISPEEYDGFDDVFVYDTPLSPPKAVQRIPTRKGFSRSFELELGGFIDSDDDEDKIKLEGEEKVEAPQSIQRKKRKLSKVHQGLTFACSGCERPLLLNAESSGRKVYALACGHLIDGYCLSFLSTPSHLPPDASKHAPKPSLPRTSSVFPRSHSLSLPARNAKRALKRAQTHRYVCPVQGCGKTYYSDLVEQPEILRPDIDLSKDQEMLWKVRFGSDGVIPVYV